MRHGPEGRSGRNSQLLAMVDNGMTEKELRAVFYEACGDLKDADSRRQAYFPRPQVGQSAGFIEVVQGPRSDAERGLGVTTRSVTVTAAKRDTKQQKRDSKSVTRLAPCRLPTEGMSRLSRVTGA